MRLKGVCWIALAAASAGCGSDPVRAPRGDGVLVLEVGGAQPSLRAALQAAGRTVDPPHWLSPRPEVASAPAQVGPAQRPPQVQPSPPPQQPAPAPAEPEQPPPESEWVTVPLPENETLIHVARRHLGDGRRYVELLEWNGWTDTDARKLPPDTPVRVRRSELRSR